MNEGTIPRTAQIGLALSGGGFRAAVFHLGVLKYMAEEGLLERVRQISTVSGGSLVTGAVFCAAGGRWPSSIEFLEHIYPTVRELLVSSDLFSFEALGLGGALRQNVRLIFRRANVLAWLVHKRWKINLKLAELPETPIWHINTTCLETGKNWRFTRDTMGDWQFGRHYSPNIAVADAIAASAAVPYVIGALKLALPKDGWWQTDPATKAPLRKIEPRHAAVRLWDGGAYENMALEPIYKPTGGLQGCDFLVCSDASAPLVAPSSMLKSLLRGKLASPRLFDISSDQIRALRSRMLMKSISQREIDGLLFRLGTSTRDLTPVAGALPGLTDEECGFCLSYPTNLSKVAAGHFDLIARHGHDVARMTTGMFGKMAPAKPNPDPST